MLDIYKVWKKCGSLLPSSEQSGAAEYDCFCSCFGAEDRLSGSYQLHFFISHVAKLLRKGLHVPVHSRLHVVVQRKHTSLYYYLVAITYSFVHDAILFEILWIGLRLLPLDGFRKAPTTALCIIVDQLDTA